MIKMDLLKITRDDFIHGKYNDKEKIEEFISNIDIITYEFENIPIEFLKLIDKEKQVLPNLILIK